MKLVLEDFDFHLPEELIAQKPANPRDRSRLLVYNRASGTIHDDHFYNLSRWLPEATVLVVNNSRVEKCRLLFEQGRTEIFVTGPADGEQVEALVRPGRKFRPGRIVEPAPGIRVETINVAPDGLRTLKLDPPLSHPGYDAYRSTPFPPYIERDESLSEKYQTVFSRTEGSKAAPTAGLHFTDRLIRELKQKGYGWEELTLHVGLGTFAPVKSESIENHTMHSEWYRVTGEVAGRLNRAVHRTAVGTTTVRVLESVADNQGRLRPESGETDIFITPGYRFRVVDSLITNFHLPKSTLLMLVAAFSGMDEMKRIYAHAIREKYRFYSFGDAMLIL